jgi:hypothetical protein
VKKNSFKIRMLVPLAIVLCFLTLTFSVSFYRLQQKQIINTSFNKFNAVRDLFEAKLANDANMLGVAIRGILQDEQTIVSLKEKDGDIV